MIGLQNVASHKMVLSCNALHQPRGERVDTAKCMPYIHVTRITHYVCKILLQFQNLASRFQPSCLIT